MRQLAFGLLALVFGWVSFFGVAGAYTVSINQFVDLPALNDAVLGFKERLAELGLEVTYIEHNAKGSTDAIPRIVDQILDENPDLVLAVSTPSAQGSVLGIKRIPIVFTCVTDPVSAKLVASLEKPGGNATGTTDMNQVSEQLALIKEIQPGAQNLGVIYNPGESNSLAQVGLAKDVAPKLGFNIIEALVNNGDEARQAAQSLVDRVDAIYLPNDNVVIPNIENIVKVALEHHIPLYPAEDSAARKGGVATLSINYYQLGRLTGQLAAKILREKASPDELPVESSQKLILLVNTRFASDVFLSVSPSIVERAQVVIK
ncbi:MAG: ABC transporter substrate-binding protein [Deltaproteobacteria bacterium]|jgi:putative ABC transport system substrate-binding protein|nr:ABC transporter substrate-binding protein [Deltaproteobacteria bacterium]